ncbi:11861_t:CDS:2 [Ambispora gerdemannii]|uniref:DNA 3'-5' helicase n=1 Tax=Ambispora gerdemannii TaxID=144530 RepID=A0A9N9AVB3_9GLOM|nr:11861_t:CDS:2 [Ambispora gerdemannii]
MTVTIAYKDIILLYDKLRFDFNKLAIIRGGSLVRSKLIYEVIKKREHNNGVMDDLMIIINQVTAEIIIYCASKQQCIQVMEMLTESLDDEILNIFYGKMAETEKNAAMKKWLSGETKVLITTSAFGMSIDVNDVRLVMHYTMPMNMSNFIQKSGRADRNGDVAKIVILYSVNTLFNTLRSDFTDAQKTDQYLTSGQQNIFEMILFCMDTYKCRLQIVAHIYAWPNESIPAVCERCDNCLRCFQDTPEQRNNCNEIEKMLDVLGILTTQFAEEIRPTDVMNVF